MHDPAIFIHAPQERVIPGSPRTVGAGPDERDGRTRPAGATQQPGLNRAQNSRLI